MSIRKRKVENESVVQIHVRSLNLFRSNTMVNSFCFETNLKTFQTHKIRRFHPFISLVSYSSFHIVPASLGKTSSTSKCVLKIQEN
jgi:hypothetical protein